MESSAASANSVHPLSALPAEILNLILAHDDVSHLVVRLWRAGDKLLNAKLSAGITRVELRSAQGFYSSVPAVLSQLRGVTHLTLRCKSMLLMEPSRWFTVLRGLPRTLTFLEIDSDDSDLVFLNYAANFAITAYERGGSSYVDIGAIFPRLETLKMRRISHLMCPALPSTLTALIGGFTDFTGPTFSELPRSLQRLESDLIIDIREPTASNDATWQDSYTELEPFLHAPPGLDYISHIYAYVSTDRQTWAAQLPKGLRDLVLAEDAAFTPELVSDLPRSLTQIKVGELFMLDWTPFVGRSQSIWPQTLQSLDLVLNDYDQGHFAALPRTLTTLSVYIPGHLAFVVFVSELPSQLTSLWIASDIEFSIEDPLPDTLTQLTLTHPKVKWNSLPPSITHLDLQVLPKTLDWASSMPNLKILEVYGCNSGEFSAVPRSVTRLRISTVKRLADGSQSHFGALVDLPHSLVSLKVSDWSLELPISAQPLAHFHQLEELLLPEAAEFSTSAFARLPRSLRNLEMTITDGDAKNFLHLPPHLTYCDFGPTATRISDVELYCPIVATRQRTWPQAMVERVKERFRALNL